MDLQPHEKYCLSIDEAAAYSGIGKNILRDIISKNEYMPFIIRKGEQIIVHRKKFENWLMSINSIG